MTGRQTHIDDGGLPEPPYSAALLADFHAGALDAVTTEHIARRLPADPRAAEILAALDRVREELRDDGRAAPDMPEAVADRLDTLIDRLTRE